MRVGNGRRMFKANDRNRQMTAPAKPTERGCVEDQPQRISLPGALVDSTLLRLVFDTAALRMRIDKLSLKLMINAAVKDYGWLE